MFCLSTSFTFFCLHVTTTYFLVVRQEAHITDDVTILVPCLTRCTVSSALEGTRLRELEEVKKERHQTLAYT